MKKTTRYRIYNVLMIIVVILLAAVGVLKVLQHDYVTAVCDALWVYIAVNSLFTNKHNKELSEAVSWMTTVIDTVIKAYEEMKENEGGKNE